MFEKFTERAGKAMSIARQEAQRLDSEFIETEHVLLGILQAGDGVAAKVLQKLNVDPQRIRQEIEKLIAPSTSPAVTLGQLPLSPRVRRALELAGEAAGLLGHAVIGTEHLLLGLFQENQGIAAQALMGLGVRAELLHDHVLAELGSEPSPPPHLPPSGDRNLLPTAQASRPLTDRPSVQEPIADVLQQGRSIALVGPKRVGKTSLVLAMCRAKTGAFTYWSMDHRMFDEFHGPDFSKVRRPGAVCLIPQAELLTVSRSVNANLLEDRMQGGERLILEFREGDLEKFAARYAFIAKALTTVSVKPPDPEECRQLLDAARARLKDAAGLEIPDDVLAEADRLARDRWRHLVAPWPTIMTLWAAESIHRETSARGDEQQMIKDIEDLEKSGDPAHAELLRRHLEGLRSVAGSSALAIESVRRAIGELSGQSQ